ncbi:thermostable hemolysin [Photobacterium sp. MCCC 1A19761]|uniref:thermostable hemolysin n=1 Tax=Photobacterium sp. MCCC 1A19761 TaxID=3115000 RepID=UPI00307DE4B0
MRNADQNSTYSLQIIHNNHPSRQAVERYIATRYRAAFHANLSEFMPAFMAVYDQSQQLHAACGFRIANQGPLFLEQYLSQPAEAAILSCCGITVQREKLVEFGQLASFSPGMSPLHFWMMAQYLVDAGYEWAIFTATDPLYAMMTRLGLNMTILSAASPDVIPDAAQTWGTYYHHQPRVSVGNLAEGLQQLSQRFSRLSNRRVVSGES